MGDPGDGDDGLGEVDGWRAAQAGHPEWQQDGHPRAALGHHRSGNAGGNAPGPGTSASDSAWNSLVQQGGHLVVTILSAQGLKDVCMFGKMSPYAVAWIEPQEKQATPAARNAGKTPSWVAKLWLRLQPHHVQAHARDHANSHSLSIQIFNGDGADAVLIGGVSIPLQDIVRSRAAVEGEEFISCQLLRPSGRIQGVVNLSVQLLPVQDGHSQGQLCSVREEPEQEEAERDDGQEAAAAAASSSNPTSSPRGQIQQHQQHMHHLQQQMQQHQHQIEFIQQTQRHQQQQVLEHSDSRHLDRHRLDTSPVSPSGEHDGQQHGEDAWGEQQQQQHHRGLRPEADAESRHPRRRMSGHFSEVAPDALDLANMGEQGHAPLPEGTAPASLATGPAFDTAGTGDPTGLGVGVGVTGGSLGAAVLVEVVMADIAGALSGGDGSIGHLF